MPKLPKFRSPADQATKDFAGRPELLDRFETLWNTNIDGFTQQAILGNPWTATDAAETTSYFNPLDTDVPAAAIFQGISWNAMPGRIPYYNGEDWNSVLTAEQINQLADTGLYTNDESDQNTFPNITKDPCTLQPEDLKYGPYGPRGWQDEYTEWSVTHDELGNIVRIDFTCENPEYWYTLWRVDPDTALRIYRETLDNLDIQLDDLCLKDPGTGITVIDPSTGRPAYNPLNKWNSGPKRTATGGGAMHLTSTPNTLQTETGLAGGATILRIGGNSNAEALLCCAQFGQAHRNSDPHIGQLTNQVVSLGYKATLADPPGLYIQMPIFSNYILPETAPPGANAADYWSIVRGTETLADQFGNPLPGNLILHAVYEVPANLGFTVSDIKIAGENIRYAAQIAATFSVQLNAMAFADNLPTERPCVGDAPSPLPQPFQMFFTSLWNAYYNTPVDNPVKFPMNLASSTVIIPPIVSPGQTGVLLTLICTGIELGAGGQLPEVGFNTSIAATVLGLTDGLTYSVPGNSYPSTVQALSLSISVAANAAPGLREIWIRNFDSTSVGPSAPAFLNVQPASGGNS